MRCKLTRLESTNNNFRTRDIVGGCPFAPTEGLPFLMSAKSLELKEPGAVRLVETTPIVSVLELEDGVVEFTTENSRYRWERLTDARSPSSEV